MKVSKYYLVNNAIHYQDYELITKKQIPETP